MRIIAIAAVAILLALAAAVSVRAETYFQRALGHPGSANCTKRKFTQYTDHYTFGPMPAGWPLTYEERVLTYDRYYKPGGPIFFYVGNEAPITAFADIAGLMWENAEAFGAALVFAEHRFYGESFPACPPTASGGSSCYGVLSTMQAMADYATLIVNLTSPSGLYPDSRGVITFGGSYGGMLSAWMRMKYPNIVTGAIACSAPVGMVSDAYDTSSYWAVVTRDATAAGGAAPNCARNVHLAIQAAFAELATADGAAALTKRFASCSPLAAGDNNTFGTFIQAAFDVMAMGNYPFPIDFMFGTPDKPAPAWPMRVACQNLGFDSNNANVSQLLDGLFAAMNVFYNVTDNVQCFDFNSNPTTDSSWNYMVCSERIINEIPYFSAAGWPNDMFYPQPRWTHEMYETMCKEAFGVHPRFGWLNTTYGGLNVGQASNIFFSNGLLDPWHSGGVLQNVSATLPAYIIPDGAHHLDLFFASPEDPPGVTFVRGKEVEYIKLWLASV